MIENPDAIDVELDALIPENLARLPRKMQPTAFDRYYPAFFRSRARSVLVDRVVARARASNESAPPELTRKLAFDWDSQLPIESQEDRIAVVQEALYQWLIGRFGNVTAMFSSDQQFYRYMIHFAQ